MDSAEAERLSEVLRTQEARLTRQEEFQTTMAANMGQLSSQLQELLGQLCRPSPATPPPSIPAPPEASTFVLCVICLVRLVCLHRTFHSHWFVIHSKELQISKIKPVFTSSFLHLSPLSLSERDKSLWFFCYKHSWKLSWGLLKNIKCFPTNVKMFHPHSHCFWRVGFTSHFRWIINSDFLHV